MREKQQTGKRHARAGVSAALRAPANLALRIPIFLFSLAVLCGISCASYAQTAGCDDLRSVQEHTYGFDPPRLSAEQREQKSREMEGFWHNAKSLGPAAVPCLREMLASDKQDPFFLYDASALLFSLDTSPGSLAAITSALAGTSLTEVDPAEYVGLLIGLSRKGVDIAPLAEKYMTYPKADSYVPQHSMKLARVDGAILLYGSMKPDVAEKYLEPLATGKDSDARPAAIFALALNMTEASFRALHAGVELAGLPAVNEEVVLSIARYKALPAVPHTPLSRDQVLKRLDAVIRGDFEHIDPANPPYVAGDDAFEASAGAQLTPADVPVLAEARRVSIRGVSDESLDEYTSLSRTMLQVIDRYDLYKKWRTHPRSGNPER